MSWGLYAAYPTHLAVTVWLDHDGVGDAGQVVGFSATSDSWSHAFLWMADEGMVDLGTLGGISSRAQAISATGQVVGSSTTVTGETHAFSWTAAGGMIDLGTLSGAESEAFGVNAAGQVVGHSRVAGEGTFNYAFWWSAATGMWNLYTSTATDINDVGHIVGYGGAFYHAFFKRPGAPIVDLGTLAPPGWLGPKPFSQARAVNNTGQIVGWSDVERPNNSHAARPCSGGDRPRHHWRGPLLEGPRRPPAQRRSAAHAEHPELR